MKNSLIAFALGSLAVGCISLPAHADQIRSPSSVLSNTGGDFGAGYTIQNAINHSGLSTDFTNGVTNFDTYLAGNPSHSFVASGNEWFTPLDVTSSTIVFDMGAQYNINRLALWNEEFAGINSMSVFTSNDPTFGTSTSVGSFNPTDNPPGVDYFSQVFTLTSTNARYVELNVTGPNPLTAEGNYVSMGEIAFATTNSTTSTPEPGAIALFSSLCISGAALLRRRRAR